MTFYLPMFLAGKISYFPLSFISHVSNQCSFPWEPMLLFGLRLSRLRQNGTDGKWEVKKML